MERKMLLAWVLAGMVFVLVFVFWVYVFRQKSQEIRLDSDSLSLTEIGEEIRQ